MNSIVYYWMTNLALLAVLIGAYFIARHFLKKKSEDLFRKWHPWLLVVIVVAYTGIPRIYAPLWEKTDAMEYTITIDGTKVTDSGKTSFQIAGDNSTLNVDVEYGSNQVSIVPRTAAEKALSSLVFHSPLVFMKSVGENTVTAWCDDSSDEYYLEVMSMANGELEVSDNHGSVFHTIEKSQPEPSVPVYQYYAYIGNLDDSYVLTINGIETHLS